MAEVTSIQSLADDETSVTVRKGKKAVAKPVNPDFVVIAEAIAKPGGVFIVPISWKGSNNKVWNKFQEFVRGKMDNNPVSPTYGKRSGGKYPGKMVASENRAPHEGAPATKCKLTMVDG